MGSLPASFSYARGEKIASSSTFVKSPRNSQEDIATKSLNVVNVGLKGHEQETTTSTHPAGAHDDEDIITLSGEVGDKINQSNNNYANIFSINEEALNEASRHMHPFLRILRGTQEVAKTVFESYNIN